MSRPDHLRVIRFFRPLTLRARFSPERLIAPFPSTLRTCFPSVDGIEPEELTTSLKYPPPTNHPQSPRPSPQPNISRGRPSKTNCELESRQQSSPNSLLTAKRQPSVRSRSLVSAGRHSSSADSAQRRGPPTLEFDGRPVVEGERDDGVVDEDSVEREGSVGEAKDYAYGSQSAGDGGGKTRPAVAKGQNMTPNGDACSSSDEGGDVESGPSAVVTKPPGEVGRAYDLKVVTGWDDQTFTAVQVG
jgi:hypothetical protein